MRFAGVLLVVVLSSTATGQEPISQGANNVGRGIVFGSSRDGNDTEDVYLMSADGSEVRRITVTVPVEGEQRFSGVPALSPDGSRIVFASNRDDGGAANLYAVSVDGKNLVRLTQHDAFDYTPDWSPDGTRLAFMSNRDGPPEIYIMEADSTNPFRLTYLERPPGGVCCPDWSPDGRLIAFHARGADGSGASPSAFQIYLAEVDGGDLHELGLGALPRWSPDGEWIAYVGVSAQAWVMRRDGTEARAVTDVEGRAMYPVWSPDGKQLAFTFLPSGLEGEELFRAAEIYRIGLDGSDLRRLTDNDVYDGHANWW